MTPRRRSSAQLNGSNIDSRSVIVTRLEGFLTRLLRLNRETTAQEETSSTSSSISASVIQPSEDGSEGTADGDEPHRIFDRCRMFRQRINAAGRRFLTRWRTRDSSSRHVPTSPTYTVASHSRNKERPASPFSFQSGSSGSTGQQYNSHPDRTRVRPVTIEPYDRVFSETTPRSPSRLSPTEELWGSVNAIRPSRHAQGSQVSTWSNPGAPAPSLATVSSSSQRNELDVGNNQGRFSLMEALGLLYEDEQRYVYRAPSLEPDGSEELDPPPPYNADCSPPEYSWHDNL